MSHFPQTWYWSQDFCNKSINKTSVCFYKSYSLPMKMQRSPTILVMWAYYASISCRRLRKRNLNNFCECENSNL